MKDKIIKLKSFKNYRRILANHQNLKMLSIMQVDNICLAMDELVTELESLTDLKSENIDYPSDISEQQMEEAVEYLKKPLYENPISKEQHWKNIGFLRGKEAIIKHIKTIKP